MYVNENVLVCRSVRFYSQRDEHYFFEWIQSIRSIARYDGVGEELYLYCHNTLISDDDLRELLALFYRYKIEMKQLAIFLHEKNKDWFAGSPKG